MNNIDKQKLINAIVSSSNGNIDRNKLNNAVNTGNISSLMQTLSPSDRQKLSSALSNKSSISSALSSNEAKTLLNSLLKGGGKNG